MNDINRILYNLGYVWIDFKLIPEMIFWKMGCLVVTSNSVNLKNISSWPNLRAKTTENHFCFHFHFKWLSALENRRERERERRDRDITSTAPFADITGTAPIARTCRSRSQEAPTAPIAISPSFIRIWWFFSGFCLCFEEWMILYIRLVTEKIEKMWVTNRKCVFYGIFKNTIKHQKIFFETFFKIQPNTWKYFPF